ncbi:MAG: molybdopterin molybdotransferase MoeA [Chloroflexi bacterium]|nr:molybdopterin molybdotransferase MoeA [Chloroflexota bacterium]
MLAVSEAQKQILSALQPVQTTTIPLEQAAGRILCADVSVHEDLPAFASSSMDGFAVRATDVASAGPDQGVPLQVAGDIPAGSQPTFRVGAGQAARIMTGAPMPAGADAVIPIEDTDQSIHAGVSDLPGQVIVFRRVRPGEYVRPAGQDLRRGTTVLPAGRQIKPQDLGLLSILGLTAVPVYELPRVALMSSGNELATPGEMLKPGQIRDANTYSLGALIQNSGARLIHLGIARDDPRQIQDLLDSAVSQGADLIITSAGVSVGAYDYVRQIIEKDGRLTFWRVNMRPGKPLAFGAYRQVTLIGLPGNPVSAFIGYLVFGQPAVRRLAGLPPAGRRRAQAILAHDVESDGRESYLRAEITSQDGRLTARLTGHQGSGNLYSLVQANALLIVPSGVKSLPAGTQVDIWPLDD